MLDCRSARRGNRESKIDPGAAKSQVLCFLLPAF